MRAFCRRGHVLDEANSNWRPDGRRRCRTCERMREAMRAGRLPEYSRKTVRRTSAPRVAVPDDFDVAADVREELDALNWVHFAITVGGEDQC